MTQKTLVIKGIKKDLGNGFFVRRSLPHKDKKMVGPFIFWDHMGPAEINSSREMIVPAHPHIGLATITYLFSGEILHRDSLGNEQFIRPGEVNWMTAGSGIVHSERSHAKDSPYKLEGIQLWLALPTNNEETQPSFFHCKENQLPLLTPNGDGARNSNPITVSSSNGDGHRFRLIAGSFGGEVSPTPTYSPLFYINGSTTKGSEYRYNLTNKTEAGIYIIKGDLEIEGQICGPGNLVIFHCGEKVHFRAMTDSKYMFFGGETFPEDRHIWWNFVSSSQEKIDQAKLKWRSNAYPKVINEHQSLPLPKE